MAQIRNWWPPCPLRRLSHLCRKSGTCWFSSVWAKGAIWDNRSFQVTLYQGRSLDAAVHIVHICVSVRGEHKCLQLCSSCRWATNFKCAPCLFSRGHKYQQRSHWVWSMGFSFRLSRLRVGRLVCSYLSVLFLAVLWVGVGFSAAVGRSLLVSPGYPVSKVVRLLFLRFAWEHSDGTMGVAPKSGAPISLVLSRNLLYSDCEPSESRYGLKI